MWALAEFSTENMVNWQGNFGKNVQAAYVRLVEILKPVFESRKWLKVGHNLQFDYELVKWCLGPSSVAFLRYLPQ
jgi:hypothetical protein